MPGNIMVTAEGGHAVLVDLGLARLADELEGTLTRTNQFVGTLRYASPEQVAGDAIDRRSDVYSLGVVLWEFLALRAIVYGGDTRPQATELGRRIKFKDADRIRKYQKGVAADLEAIVLKCLDKDRDRRYPTARELAEDLGRWLRSEPVQAQPPTLRYFLRKLVYRHRAALAAALLILIVAASLGAATVYNIKRARDRAERILQLTLDTNLDYTQFAEELKPIAGTQSETVKRILTTVEKNYERLIKEAGATTPLVANRSRMQNAFSEVYLSTGDTEGALSSALNARDDYRLLISRDADNGSWAAGLGTSLERAGMALAYQGKLAEAMTFLRESLAKREQLVRLDPTHLEWQADLASSESGIALVLYEQGDLPARARAVRAAYKLLTEVVRKAPDNTEWQGKLAASERLMALVLSEEGAKDSAVAAYKKSLAQYEDLARRQPERSEWQRNLARLMMSIGQMAQERGDSEAALASMRQALQIAERFKQLDTNDAEWLRQVIECKFFISDVQKTENSVDDINAQVTELRSFEPVVAAERKKAPHYDRWRKVAIGDMGIMASDLTKLARSASIPIRILRKRSGSWRNGFDWKQTRTSTRLRRAMP
jgi:tetratricopeptide (TPR) repeat protein